MHPIGHALLAFFCSLTLLSSAHAREQIALVIGNSAYEGEAQLDNPANDATAVARELRKLNFTTVIEVIDGNREQMESALGQFLETLGPEKLGLFYYAGHGVQIDGVNYLLPVGTTFERAYDVKYKSLSLNQIMDAINEAGSLPNAVVLDCCRNNPFRGLNPSRGVRGQGLAEVANQQGTLVAFSTAAGTTAADQDRVLKDHSPYTAALLMEMRGPREGHYELGSLFRNVAQRVHQSTGQDPLLNIPGSVGNYDLKSADFMGNASGPAATMSPTLSPADAMERVKQLELQGEAKTKAMQAQMEAMAAKMVDLEKQASEPKIVVMQPPPATSSVPGQMERERFIAPPPPDRAWVIACQAENSRSLAESHAQKWRSRGLPSQVIWIPDYASLSGAQLWLTCVGPYDYDTGKSQARKVLHQNVLPYYRDAYGIKMDQSKKRETFRD